MAPEAKKVDYNQIAETYDQRYSVNQLAGVAGAIEKIIMENPSIRVLEVGCGTGRWIITAAQYTQQVFGLDLSMGMLGEAGKKSREINLICGRASEIPFQDHHFDFVYCVNALHHFMKPEAFIAEAFRLLRPEGCLGIVGMDAHDPDIRWYVYDYFHDTLLADQKRFHPWNKVMNWMAQVGFDHLNCSPVEHIIDHKAGRSILDDPFLQKELTSQLTLLSELEYQRGLQNIMDAIRSAEQNGKNAIFQVKLRLDLLVGYKPKSS